ncbi:MAG: hypothetical protein ACE5GA_10485 [Candidatus Zixiibacteriota bacterium]
MSEEKKNQDPEKPKKRFWHLYSLQVLGPEKFSKIVDRILRRDCGLIK